MPLLKETSLLKVYGSIMFIMGSSVLPRTIQRHLLLPLVIESLCHTWPTTPSDRMKCNKEPTVGCAGTVGVNVERYLAFTRDCTLVRAR